MPISLRSLVLLPITTPMQRWASFSYTPLLPVIPPIIFRYDIIMMTTESGKHIDNELGFWTVFGNSEVLEIVNCDIP